MDNEGDFDRQARPQEEEEEVLHRFSWPYGDDPEPANWLVCRGCGDCRCLEGVTPSDVAQELFAGPVKAYDRFLWWLEVHHIPTNWDWWQLCRRVECGTPPRPALEWFMVAFFFASRTPPVVLEVVLRMEKETISAILKSLLRRMRAFSRCTFGAGLFAGAEDALLDVPGMEAWLELLGDDAAEETDCFRSLVTEAVNTHFVPNVRTPCIARFFESLVYEPSANYYD